MIISDNFEHISKDIQKRIDKYCYTISAKEFREIFLSKENFQFRCFANGAVSEKIVRDDISHIRNYDIKNIRKGNDSDKTERNGDVIFESNGKTILVQVKTPKGSSDNIRIDNVEKSICLKVDLQHSDGVRRMVLPDRVIESKNRIRNYRLDEFHILAIPTFYITGRKDVIYCLSVDLPKDVQSSYLLKRNIGIKYTHNENGGVWKTDGVGWTTDITKCLEKIKRGYIKSTLKHLDAERTMIDDL